MSDRRFLYCRGCNAVHHVTGFDAAPLFVLDGEQFREIGRDDRRQFLDTHASHAIHELVAIDVERKETNTFIDPMKVSYLEISDGREFLTLRVSRRTIADPLTYEVLPRQLALGDLPETPPTKRRAGKASPLRKRSKSHEQQAMDYLLFDPAA